MMPLTQPIQWNDISIDERDLTNLEHKITRCLTGDEPYVWLFASPETVGTTLIANLTMEDQLNVHGAAMSVSSRVLQATRAATSTSRLSARTAATTTRTSQ
jgi:hypothetical protein